MIENNTAQIKEHFENDADEMGFCLDQEWRESENPYVDENTFLAFEIYKKGFQAFQKTLLPQSVIDAVGSIP
jgi:hypothetical protein